MRKTIVVVLTATDLFGVTVWKATWCHGIKATSVQRK